MRNHQSAGTGDAVILSADRLPGHDGDIARAMNFKKATVFALGTDDPQPLIQALSDEELTEGTIYAPGTGEMSFSDQAVVYLLYGWSGWGGDDLRQTAVDRALLDENVIEVYVTRPTIEHEEAIMGTADMKFIGWTIEVGMLATGEYTLCLYESTPRVRISDSGRTREVIEESKYQLRKEIKYQVR